MLNSCGTWVVMREILWRQSECIAKYIDISVSMDRVVFNLLVHRNGIVWSYPDYSAEWYLGNLQLIRFGISSLIRLRDAQ